MTLENPGEPYFSGQASSSCGHFYPDVVRVADLKKDGKFVRILDCVHCGPYGIEVKPNSCSTSDINLDDFRATERQRIVREKATLENSIIPSNKS